MSPGDYVWIKALGPTSEWDQDMIGRVEGFYRDSQGKPYIGVRMVFDSGGVRYVRPGADTSRPGADTFRPALPEEVAEYLLSHEDGARSV